jgi:hypothetical protein
MRTYAGEAVEPEAQSPDLRDVDHLPELDGAGADRDCILREFCAVGGNPLNGNVFLERTHQCFILAGTRISASFSREGALLTNVTIKLSSLVEMASACPKYCTLTGLPYLGFSSASGVFGFSSASVRVF